MSEVSGDHCTERINFSNFSNFVRLPPIFVDKVTLFSVYFQYNFYSAFCIDLNKSGLSMVAQFCPSMICLTCLCR
jgi:hypothetical protein